MLSSEESFHSKTWNLSLVWLGRDIKAHLIPPPSLFLALDDADDPMEMKIKLDCSEENISKRKVARVTE